ncbi:MAG: biotin carboxylase, partial [Desulfamplus sp.]|nr:biotin carboxylase [Desulfamplus sp.]
DILKLTLDFACKQKSIFNNDIHKQPCNLVGLRIHANKAGILKSIDISMVKSDSRVREIFIKRKPGDQIILPPQNYDSWNMGHIIFEPYEDTPCKDQCMELLSILKIKIV